MSLDGSGSTQRLPRIAPGTAPDAALAQLIRRLAVARSLDEVAQTVAAPARNLMQAGGVTFVLRDEGDVCFYLEEDAIAPLWKGRRFPMEACISGWCMLNAQAAVIPDIYDDTRIPQDAYRPTFVRSLVMVPVPQDRPIAAMGAYWSELGEPAHELVELLQAIGNAAALAIARIRAEEQALLQSTLGSELSHRVKNLFAIVQALINQTRGSTVDEYRTALGRRVQGLAPVYAAIHASASGEVDLRTVFASILAPVTGRGADGLDLSGPPVVLSEARATQIALIASELATNAVKHGALSSRAGRVEVRWTRDGDDLRLTWKETGGPPVAQPEKEGFGTTLLNGIVTHSLHGEIDLRYESDGLRCELRIPLQR